MRSEKAAFDLEEMKLKRMDERVKKCVIRAPKAGMVVYASDRFWYNEEGQVKQGAQVNDQQTLLRLPDLSQMQAKVSVHESKVEKLRRGMPAEARIQGRTFKGKVFSVANQPEPPRWFSPFAKKYETIVKVEGISKDLRPGLTVEVEILVAHRKGVISVPVAAVYEQAGKFLCFVKKGDATEKRFLTLGQSNDKFVEVEKGVQVGEQVVLNPQSLLGEAGATGQKTADEEKKTEAKPSENRAQPAR
jgi:multidrug efflux pump subunit AcrA (membrane-fusion protein)